MAGFSVSGVVRNLATKLARRASHAYAFHAAVITRGGAIVSTGYNHDAKHAERVALGRMWPSECKGATLYSMRVRRDGSLANGRPCRECMMLIAALEIKKIVYSDSRGQMHTERVRGA